MAKGFFHWLPYPTRPKARDPGGSQVHLRKVDNCSSKTSCSVALLASKFYIYEFLNSYVTPGGTQEHDQYPQVGAWLTVGRISK